MAVYPELFGKPTQLLGWQGLSATIPQSWNLVSFGGDFSKGTFRLADDDGLRLEVLWERPKNTPDVSRSVELLLKGIAKDAKKQKYFFKEVESPKLVPRSRKEHANKEQLANFGWQGDARQTASHGFGAAWFCPVSNRVVVAHAVGLENDNPEKTRRMAAEVLSSFQSHGTGGWQTWSAFGLQLEMPEEFHLTTAKMQTGRLEFDWERVRAHESLSFLSPSQWGLRAERVGLRRISAANVVLENEALDKWAARVTPGFWKKLSFGKWEATPVLKTEGFISKGRLKDFRLHLMNWLLDKVLRRRSARPELTAWHDETDNKIFVLMCDLWPINESIKTDILESLQSRTI
jgi:hypothetical protein